MLHSDAKAIRYRILERVGADASEYAWLEVDTGTFTAMPRHYVEPTMADAKAYAARFDRDDRVIQFWEEDEEHE